MTIPETVSFKVIARKGGGKGGSGGGNTSSHTASEAPNTLRSQSTARILEVLSEGPIKGLATGDMKSVYLDKTPILNSDGSANFTVAQFDFRNGDPSQDVIPGFAAGESEKNVGVELQSNVPIVRRITPGVDGVRIKVRLNALYRQTTEGDVVGSGVDVNVEWNLGGAGWVLWGQISIYGKTMSAYERALRVQLPQTNQTIDIRLTRISDPPTAAVVNSVYWSGYTEIVDQTLSYDDTALAALVIDAQYFPNVPTRGYLLDGVLFDVPSNYNPVTRTYSGDWDGTFKSAFTNNPAWVLYGFLTSKRFGVGDDIDVSGVDKWSFYEAGQYNDVLVQDGAGGRQPRYTCNFVLSTREDAYKVLNAIASNMRSLLYYANGTVFLVQDRPSLSPARLFSPANVTGGVFDYASGDYRSKFNAVNVSWNDPSQDYTPGVELVQDPELIALQPYRPTSSTAFGCTVRGEAIRHGRAIIFTNQFEDEIVTFRTSLENADVRPGEEILIQDPSRAGARLAGRTLAASTITEIHLDAPAKGIAAGWKLYLTIDNDIITTSVISVISESVVVVSGNSAPVPAGTVWLAANTTIEPTPWRVVSVKENDKNSYEILASFSDPGKQSYIDDGVYIPPPPYSLVPTGPLVNGTDIRVKEYIYRDSSGVPQFGVLISWEASTDSRVAYYMMELNGPADDYRKVSNITGISLDVPLMRSGAWTVTLSAVDNLGRRALPLQFTFNTVGLTERPSLPSAFYAVVNGASVDLTWIPTDEIDVVFWWLAWHPATDGTAKWEQATTLLPRIGYLTTHATAPARTGTYFIKTIDALGQSSKDALASVIYQSVRPPNEIVTLIEQPTWRGNMGGHFYLAGNEIHMDPPTVAEPVPPEIYPGLRGTTISARPTRYSYYTFYNSMNMGAVGSMVLTAIIEAYGSIGDNSMSTWVPLAIAVPLAQGSSNQWDASIEIRGSNDGATWTEWQPIKSGTVLTNYVQARLAGLIYDTLTKLRVTRAELIVDVPDRDEGGSNVTLDAGGRASVVYAQGFYAVPNVQLTGFSLPGVSTTLVIIASTKAGFTVEQRGAGGVVQGGGSFNWQAFGYGVS